ncbi:MAG TPA: coagulation factor 5/8 type domain-containing protein [Gaiellaceae bacterium]
MHQLSRRTLGAIAVLAGALALAFAGRAGAATPDFGANVKIFDPSMSTAQIQSVVDSIHAQQVDSEFGTGRYALLFKPGTYGATDPLVFSVGYYTQVAGLGASPTDVTLNGEVNVHNRCLGPGNCVALVNFWRSLENMTINVAGQHDCDTSAEMWAVSQAAPVRRVNVHGFTTFMDYCTPPSFASGGFAADSKFSDSVVLNGSQQQFLVRNSDVDFWTNAVWNQVFAGVVGAPAQSFPSPPFTTLDTNPESREKPFLTVDSNDQWSVFVPDAQRDGVGPTWASGPTPGHSIPIADFFVAKPSDSVQTINAALAQGKNLLFTPGVYAVGQTIKVKRPDTIVLGLGMPTLDAQNGVVPMTVADVKGVEISGLIFDAGPVNSPALLRVGTAHPPDAHDPLASDPSDPTALHDVFFRIGGPHVGKATVSLEVNADNAILDDIWAWRADHGSGVGWTSNTADTGVVVNGDDVIATGLFAEHFQRYDVIWNGENGKTIMFQNEMPYDPPNQAAWGHDGVLGFAAYKVADSVKTHEAWGLGSYCFFNVDPTIHASRAIEVPVTPGVRLHDLLSLSITAHGVIDHVVNDTGAPTDAFTNPSNVVSFP